MRFYKNNHKDNPQPLQEVPILELLDGEVYITEEGARVLYDDENSVLEIVQESELNLGQKIYELSKEQLNLYWILMDNMIALKKNCRIPKGVGIREFLDTLDPKDWEVYKPLTEKEFRRFLKSLKR